MEVKILDKVWIMLNNVPIEITITKIITTISVDENGDVIEDSKAFAKYSETLNDLTVVNLNKAKSTKTELMTEVFNL